MSDQSEPVAMKLRQKYLVTTKPKFGGKKRKGSNEGKVGRVARRTKRCIAAGSDAARRNRGK